MKLFQSDIFCPGKRILYSQMWTNMKVLFVLFFLTKMFVLHLCNCSIAENANIVGNAYCQKRKYLECFQFLKIVKM